MSCGIGLVIMLHCAEVLVHGGGGGAADWQLRCISQQAVCERCVTPCCTWLAW
jgi:hypothetical protein